MKARIGWPDPSPPGFRAVVYWLFCWMNRHPGAWRAIGALCRFWPFLCRTLGFAARRSSVKQVLTRPKSFSNTAHNANLFAGEFLIGMDPGQDYDADKALFHGLLSSLNVQADADAEALVRSRRLASARTSFDLIEDYLLWVVFNAIRPAMGLAAPAMTAGSTAFQPDEELERQYLHEVRYVAGQLFLGAAAPTSIQRRAELCADSLRARVKCATALLRNAWAGNAAARPFDFVFRNGVGFAWVSHPVTVQSAALVVQELLERPKVYTMLLEKARSLGQHVWTCEQFRQEVRTHVIELMRFRPVFTVLSRDVPRETEFEAGGRRNAVCPAGSSVTILSLAAQFDPRGVPTAADYCPHRDWGREADSRFLMFGYGSRQCPARDQSVEMITSALIGLLTLPRLTLADPWGRRIRYDGPLIRRMRVQAAWGVPPAGGHP
ncbi:hypothetical protein [Variovorax saccharolyticus]|uniref:hypothetical protein n=1 Tax=Variovorax saccharolyticus TaxID=3053516 RepID=UPI0025753953|nr:hypothetical protein [Variovorax sp. J22R187]MDM0022165.1 hypothetical protein [Variovorax sp. J22R187]